jgi:hypothetical protein
MFADILRNDPLLRQMKNDMVRRIGGGAVRWFTPDAQFWSNLAALAVRNGRPITFIDCGTGMGHLPYEAQEKGFSMIGIDIGRRDSGHPVAITDAIDFPFSPVVWPIICRPCHDGFAEVTFENARKAGAGCIYVGLKKNVVSDLGGQRRHFREMFSTVGAEGERMWFAAPRERRSKGGSAR